MIVAVLALACMLGLAAAQFSPYGYPAQQSAGGFGNGGCKLTFNVFSKECVTILKLLKHVSNTLCLAIDVSFLISVSIS